MASNKTYIPDASVLIKWIGKEEELKTQAIRFQSDHANNKITLLAPTLLMYELSNYIGRNFPTETASSLLSQFLSINLQLYQASLKISTTAFNLMKELPKVSFYDASYHALAIEKNATFLTSDAKYYKKAKAYGHIELLKDYC